MLDPLSLGPANWRFVAAQPGWAATLIVSAPLALQTAMQFKGKKQIGEFALGIGAKACVFPLPMQVAEIHAAASMGHAADVDDPAAGRLQQEGQQRARQGKVAQVIDAELSFKALRRFPARNCHYAGIVNQDVQPGQVGAECFGTATNGLQVRQVELYYFKPEPAADFGVSLPWPVRRLEQSGRQGERGRL